MAKDTLAAGGKTYTSPTIGENMTQKAWDAIFLKDEEFVTKYGQTKKEYYG